MNPLLKAAGKLVQLLILLYFVVLFYDKYLLLTSGYVGPSLYEYVSTNIISYMLGVLSIFVFIDFVHIVKNEVE